MIFLIDYFYDINIIDMMKKIFTILFITTASFALNAQKIEPVISTYLGNEQRNFYGNLAPEKLDTIWTLYLGEGISPAYGNPDKLWKGAGWTGQPLFIREDDKNYLIQPSFDYNLKKIDAETGKIIWEYKYDDILKGSPTFWENTNEKDIEKRYIIMQGSRRGRYNSVDEKHIPSFRAISYMTGKELWRMDVRKTDSYSRDVDGSAIVINDTAYLALENGIFTIFDPNPRHQQIKNGFKQPKIYKEIQYYTQKDVEAHGNDLVAEASPAVLNGIIYTPSGSGHIYGHSIKEGRTVWDFHTGTDLNGSPAVTHDSCLIIAVEKQYTAGPGGVFKLNPAKYPEESVVWYYPTPNKKWYHWEGGIIGSAAVNDAYVSDDSIHIAAFIDVNGYLTLVNHDEIDPNRKALGPDGKTWYPTPKLICREKIAGTISTPLIVRDKLIAPTDNGLLLYKIDLKNDKLILLDKVYKLEIDATPIAVNGRIYVGVRDGYLYCFGKK